jgi:cardiolipin synthase
MKPVFFEGNALALLQSGVEFFPALLSALERAQSEVFLETYIFEPDATGHRIAEALVRAAVRGVQVRLLVDGFGSARFVHELLPVLTQKGVAVLVYRPEIALWRIRRGRLRRLHRKLCVVDGRCAFVGGINIINDFDPPDSIKPRLDFAVQIEGPVVAPIYHSVRRVWELVSWASFRRRPAVVSKFPAGLPLQGSVRAAFLIRDNIRHRRDIEQAYIAAIEGAKQEVLIANAYFLPGRAFALAMQRAAGRGVAIILVLQGRAEYRIVHYATQALYGTLLSYGVKIVEYDHSFLHAKVAVVDGRWATVGSSNIDPFSLLVAREANLVVEDRAFAQGLRDRLVREIESGGRRLIADDWEKRSWMSRLLNRLAYTLLRFFIGLAGHRGDH